jgi:serine/threonine protein kinase
MGDIDNEIIKNKIEEKKDQTSEEDEEDIEKDILNKVFFDKYKCTKKLGEGSFGMIFKGEYNNEYFALKFEPKNSINLLENEANIMLYLKGPNIPYVKSFGTSENYNILIMQLLGRSLEDIFEERKYFSLKSVCMLAPQMISVLEFIHNKHIVHRDIKPDNFVMGLDDLSQYVYLLDFGLAKKYRSSSTLVHYPMVNKKKLTGTARYASINALKGNEQSRRDDLEALGYVLMYLLRGSLPWQGLQAKNKEERYKKIMQKKIDTNSYDLCYGFPSEFERYVEYCKSLEYTEEPRYEMLKEGFMRVLRREHCKFDYIYDWTTEEDLKLRSNQKLILKNDIGNGEVSKKNGKNGLKIHKSGNDDDFNGSDNKKNNHRFKGNDSEENGDNKDNGNNKNFNGKETVCCSGCYIY